eukprot:995630-Amorphochlora_amoeboformis.AAC.1
MDSGSLKRQKLDYRKAWACGKWVYRCALEYDEYKRIEFGYRRGFGYSGVIEHLSNAEVLAPTTEELINLKETALLFKSNLFKLQIDELLREVTPAAVPDIDDGRKASAPLDKYDSPYIPLPLHELSLLTQFLYLLVRYLRELKSVLVAMPSKDVTLKPKTSVLDSVRVPYLKPLTFTVKP